MTSRFRPTDDTLAMLRRVLAVAAMALVACGGPAADAANPAELPADTNAIESLTAEQARKLVEEFPGFEVQDPRYGISYKRALPLNGLRWLDTETARAVAAYRHGPLLLNGLTTLSAAAARELAAFDTGERTITTLHLDGLTSLAPEAAVALVEFRGDYISLDGLVDAVGRSTPRRPRSSYGEPAVTSSRPRHSR
jgi:hypothetical protein